MKIRIVKQPQGDIEGLSLDAYHVGQVYDVAANLANYLVAEGFAIFEKRENVRRKKSRPTDRRKKR